MRLLFLLLALLLSTQSQCAWSSPALSEWVLEQDAQDLGEHTVTISHDAVKIECHTLGYIVIAKAPDWKIYCFRPVEKKIWIGKLDLFNGIILANPFAVPKKSVGNLHLAGQLTYAGTKCQAFRPENATRYVVYATNEIDAGQSAKELLHRYYFILNTNEVPLYRKIENPDNSQTVQRKEWLAIDLGKDLRTQPRVVLSTKSVKKIPLKNSDFDVPTDFTRVGEVTNVTMSKAKQNQFTDMVDELGFTHEYKSAKPASH